MFSKHSPRDSKITEVEVEEALPAVSPPEPFFHAEPSLDYPHYEPILDPESEFPWHHPDSQIPDAETSVPEIDTTQFHDPWDIYRGHIPPNIDNRTEHSRQSELHTSENHEEIRKYAWDYMSPQDHHSQISTSEQSSNWQQNFSQPQFEHVDHSHLDFRGNVWDYNPQYNYNEDHQSSHDFFQHTPSYDDRQQDHTTQYTPDNYQQQDHRQYEHLENSQKQPEIDYNFNNSLHFEKHSIEHAYDDHNHEISFLKDSEKTHFPVQPNHHRIEQVYYVHLDHENEQNKNENNKTELESKMNGDGESDCEYFENIRPRHPYDGFYLRHRVTIDSRGRKICTHEVPPTPTPTPPESPTPENNWDYQRSEAEEEITQSNGIEDQTGVAGNLARVVLGAGAQREALDDLTRRQGWEAGNIDYMGADAFDNIWAKISQTLSQPRSSPPKQSTPPPAATPAPEVAPPVEEKPAETPAPVEAPAPQAPVVEAPAPAIPLEASVPAEAPIEKPEAAKTEAPVEAAKPSESQAPVETPAPVEASAPVEAAAPVEAPATPEPVKPTEPAVEVPAPEPAAAPAAVEPAKTVAAPAEEPKVATPAETPASPAVPVEAPVTPSETKTQAPEAAAEPPKATSPPQSPVAAVPSKPEAPKPEVTPEKGASPTDSPPLANTPSKEEVPIVPAAKSTEEAAQETRL